MNHGFIKSNIEKEHYVYGAQQLPTDVLVPERDWTPFLPVGERQNRGKFETYGCTIYNTLHALEILEKMRFNEENDYAERVLYILSNTKPPGNDPHTIAELIRNTGLSQELILPFDDSITSLDQYASPVPLPQYIINDSLKWVLIKSLFHEWVFTDGHTLKEKQERIWNNLQFSPICVSVNAWQERNELYFKDGEDNHWTILVGGIKNDHWIVFDSYEPFIKKLEWEYDFGCAKRYYIEKKLPVTQSISEKHNFCNSFFGLFTHYFPKPA